MTSGYSPLPGNELWLCHYACVSWSDPELWIRYFTGIQEILGADITHLDKNDPVRRRVRTGQLAETAEYVTTMGKREDSRWLFGRIESLGIEFDLRHHRQMQDWPNSMKWYLPPELFGNSAHYEAVCRLFNLGNSALAPFYAYADTKDLVIKKKCRFQLKSFAPREPKC